MDLLLSAAELDFREELRRFLAAELDPAVVARVRSGFPVPKEDRKAWNRRLAARGWAAPSWPTEFGGAGFTPAMHHIYEQETHAAGAPLPSWFGIRLVGPVIIRYGSDAQKRRFLPPILDGSEFWCQGFSEPGAGSDLANVRTTARRDGDRYIVNGQKIWTTEAHDADWGFFLVRTEATERPQQGISFLLADMRSPGISVRPIHDMAGNHHFNEVFLDEVEVPAANIVGEVNAGWTYAKFLLSNERTASAEVYWSKRELARARRIAAATPALGGQGVMTEDPVFALRLAETEIDLVALEWSVLRALSGEEVAHPAATASALKLRGSELQQRVTRLCVDALGREALRRHTADDWQSSGLDPERAGAAVSYQYGRAYTIYGGSREIQKDLVARAAFGF